MKKVLLFCGLAVALFGISGCGGSSDSKTEDGNVKLVMWHTFSDVETKIFDKDVVDKYQKDHPNVKIESVRMPAGDEYNQQLVQAISGNSAPDLARVEVTAVPKYAKLGALEKLDGYDGFDKIKEEMHEAPLSTNKYKDGYYGLPLDTNTRIAIFNNSLLEKAGVKEVPADFDTLIEETKDIIGKDTFLFGPSGSSTWGLMPYFYSLGGAFTNEDYTKATGFLDSKDSIKALQTIVDWNKAGYFGKSLTGGLGTWEGLNGNNYMMIDDGPWYFPANEAMQDKVTYTQFPKGKAGSIEVIGGENTIVFKSSKQKEEAYKFAEYLASDDVQTIFAEKLSMLPVNKKTAEKDVVKNNALMSAYSEQLETAVSRIPSPEWDQIDKVISLAFETAISGKGTPEQVLKDATPKVEELLNK